MTSVNLTDAVNELINGTVRSVARRHGSGNRSILKILANTHFCVSYPPSQPGKHNSCLASGRRCRLDHAGQLGTGSQVFRVGATQPARTHGDHHG
jgi:hypothetical protein